MTTKPTGSQGLGRTWALGGTATDPDTIIAGKVNDGWIVEFPPFEFMNWIQRFSTQYGNYLNEVGIPVWDTETETAGYPNNSYQISPVNGGLYISNTVSPVGEPSASSDWDIFTGGGGGGTTDDITNASSVSGATCTNALNTLLNSISTLTSNAISNVSTVTGVNVTAALNTLASTISGLTSSAINNASVVAGATVTAALDTLATAVTALTSSGIANASSVAGATVTDALNTLFAGAGAGVSEYGVITSDQSISGTTPATLPGWDSIATLEANKRYAVVAMAVVSSSPSPSGGGKIQMFVPAGADAPLVAQWNSAGSTPGFSQDQAAGVDPSLDFQPDEMGGNTYIEISGFINMGVTPGVLNVGWAETTGPSGTFTVHEGSWLQVTELP